MTHPAGWLDLPEDTRFGLGNLPFGVFSPAGDDRRRIGVRVGDQVLDVAALAQADGRDDADVLGAPVLNQYMASGREVWQDVRAWLTTRLSDDAGLTRVGSFLVPMASVRMHLPITVADFVDFYSSAHHAANVGRILRPEQPPLLPNWSHMPVGYHGRAGTVVVSGTDVIRPRGQQRPPQPGAMPPYGPSSRLDIEAEVGFVVGVASSPGRPVSVADIADHVFGVCLLNDWSARDLQAWEYVPLGPFLGKSFATSMSPWIVSLDALDEARCAPPQRLHPLLPHLADHDDPWGLDLDMEIRLNGTVLSRPPFREMYWTAAQQLAHMTSNGAHVRTGDLYGSGTVSGPEDTQLGSLLEISRDGASPVRLEDGSTRGYLADGDTVVIAASAAGPAGIRIGFGEVLGTVRAAPD